MIHIHGSGVTALACERLLSIRGIAACRIDATPGPGPVVLVADETLKLLSELFADPGIARLGHPVPRRIVYRPGEVCRSVEAPSHSLALEALAARLGECALAPPADDPSCSGIRIDATGRQARMVRELTGLVPSTFGRRQVLAARLSVRRDSAVLEFTKRGWLFLFPVSTSEVVVQAMVPEAVRDPNARLAAALAESRHLCPDVSVEALRVCAVFDAAPAISPVLGSDRWLAVGSAAFAADPICGDGIGVALQSARLAAAILAQAGGRAYGGLLDHYHKRHQRAFTRHLHHVARHYQPLLADPAWALEMRPTRAFLEGATAARILGQDLGYVLHDGSLIARAFHKPDDAHGSASSLSPQGEVQSF
jgi:hypothetical protein